MRLLRADHRFKRVYDIGGDWLAENRITAMILDVDNTLTEHGSQEVDDRVLRWLGEMRALGIRLVVLSNNRDRRVRPFAEKLGLDYIANGMKPLPSGIRRASARLGAPRDGIAVVGDQVFTDVLGGNLAGLRTILLEPISSEKGCFLRLKRRVEKSIKQ